MTQLGRLTAAKGKELYDYSHCALRYGGSGKKWH